MDITIEQIKSKDSRYMNQLVEWMYNWWGILEGWDIIKVNTFMENCICEDRIPQTFVALVDYKVVGVYQITMEDLDVRPDLYPWLVNLYVDEAYRFKGVGEALIRHSIEQMKSLKIRFGYKTAFLYTKHIGLFEKYGFEYLGEIETFKKETPLKRLYSIEL